VLGATIVALVASGCGIVRVSVSSTGAEGSKASSRVLDVTDDGRYTLYLSDADNLVPGDTNRAPDVFRHDAQTRETIRASVGPNGTQALNGAYDGAMSADGRYVAFATVDHLDPAATDLGAAYVRDLSENTTTWVSRPPALAGGLPEGSVGQLAISADGRLVSFLWRTFTALPVSPTALYRWDGRTGVTTKLSETQYLSGMHASSDGRHFVLQPTCLQGACFPVPVLIDTDGTGARWRGLPWQACTFTRVHALSAEGRFQVVHSAGGLPLPCLDPGTYLVDRMLSRATPIPGLDATSVEGISRDGTSIVFIDDGSFLPGGTPGQADLYQRDLVRQIDYRLNLTPGGSESDGDVGNAVLSDIGHRVAFSSTAHNLVDNDHNGVSDVFVRPIGVPAAP
jgi:hypothetical protein